MIERLLAGESALADGDLSAAERLFRQVADADARNAIAVVGLARVAQRRGDQDLARAEAERALSIDPEEAAATRLIAELDRAPAPAPEAATGQRAAEPPEPAHTPDSPRIGGWRAWLARLLRRR